MAACEEARHLLAVANKDFRALQGMADPHVFADEVFRFHAQQTAEKALKAWLARATPTVAAADTLCYH